MRGDDIEGLRIAEALLADLPALRATIETLKERDGTIGAPEDRLKFLDDIPALAADLKRRTTSPAVATKPPDPNDPDALVRALDEARERQLGQPGVVVIADDPNVRRLATRGDAAVPALLKALEGDDRLTRSVGFGRDFWPERVIYTVRSAAYAALLKIAGQDEIPGARRSDGTLDVPAVRAYMAANRGLSPAQRLLRAMETPVAPDDIGNDASATVRRLLDPPGSERGKFTYQGVPFDRLDSGRAKTADALAPAEHARLVAALDARTRESLATPEGQGYDAFRVGTACDLAVGRALIEPRGALPLLREVWAGVGRTNPGWFDQNPQMVADLVAVRVSLGDEGFRKEGVAWLGAHLRELAGFSFEAPPARLAPLLRRAAVEALTDRTVVGTLTLLSNGSIGLASKVGSSQAESEVKEVGYQLDSSPLPRARTHRDRARKALSAPSRGPGGVGDRGAPVMGADARLLARLDPGAPRRRTRRICKGPAEAPARLSAPVSGGLYWTMIAVTLVPLLAASTGLATANLVANGDFSSGNADFESDYRYAPPATNALYPESVYTLVRNTRSPFVLNTAGIAEMGDHTGEGGLALFVNGSESVDSTVWRQRLTGLRPGATYSFEVWVARWTPNPSTSANISVSFDGASVTSFSDPMEAGVWVRQTASFVARTGVGTLLIRNVAGKSHGNDFGLDDISVRRVATASGLR